MKDFKNNIKFFKLTTLILFGVILLEILFSKKILNRFCPSQNSALVQDSKPTAETKVEKNFEFPLKKNSKEVFEVKILKAERVKVVASKNQPVSAKEGEDFLLFFLEIENNSQTPLVVDSQNYFRLIGEGEKKLAPDFYNGPIQVAAISTKADKVGFVVKENEKQFKVQVGAIDGVKEIVEFKF